MPTLLLNDSLSFNFDTTFSNTVPNWITFVKEVFDLMLSLESDATARFSLFMHFLK